MKIDELFERADIDVRESMWAETARLGLIARIKSDPRFRTQVVGLKTGSALVDHMIARLTFSFEPNGDGGEYRHNNRGYGHELVIEIPTKEITAETVLRHLSSRRGAATFRHEFQHFLDRNYVDAEPVKQMPYSRDKVRAGDESEQDAYINNDLEFASYLKELAEPLLAILRAAKQGDEETLRKARIEPDFRKYIRTQHYMDSVDLWGVLDRMNSGYRVRLLKRLAALHKAATALSGVSQPYSPGRRDQIIMWLGKTLKTLGVGKDKAWGKTR